MRSRRSFRSSLVPACACLIAIGGLVGLVPACKQPAAVVVDAGPPPAATDAAVAQLVPLDEDANAPDAAVAAVPVHHGPGLSTNQARAKQCCSALRAQAKALGASPEANMIMSFAMQCDAVAMQMGPTSGGQAPEFGALRQLLKGHNMPPMCQGL